MNQEKKGRTYSVSSLPPDLIDEDQIEEVYKFNMSDIPAMILFWVLIIIVFLQFFTRYVLNDSLGWTEEIARFLLVLLGFVGSVTVTRKGSHIFLEFFYRFITVSWCKVLVVASQIVCIIFYAYCTYLSAIVSMEIKQSLVSIDMPKSYLYYCITFCFFMMSVHSLIWLVRRITQTGDEIVCSLSLADYKVPD